jgi:hypothetical protein
MDAAAAFRDGLGRARRAPALVGGTFLLTLLVSLPLAIALQGMLAAQLGDSATANTLLTGTDYDWWQEFLAHATGLGTTFVPSIIGFGAVLLDLSNLLDNVPLATTIAGAVGAWLVLWSFLSGGILDRLARDRPTRARGFFGACGAHFPAIVRLGILALVVYGVLFRFVHPVLFASAFGRLTRNMTAERQAFAVQLALYLIFGFALITVNLLFDYARIRIVVEDRRSAIGALTGAARFARRNRGAVAAVYAMNALLFVALLLVYAALTRAIPTGGAGLLALSLGELYILARHFLKLAFAASETALFQGRLAHAAYTAAPPVLWPESPAAEAIANAAGPNP